MKAPVSQAEPRIPRRRSKITAAFGYRDFRLLWFGLLVSNLGTWMQFTTLGYFVAYLAGSPARAALYVGFLGASRAVPAILFSPLAGVVADQYPRRRILLTTSTLTSFFSVLLATLTLTHHINLVEIFVLSGALAATQSFDAPARQSWLPFIVSKEHFANAVGLNQIAFNSPSIVGPPIAGILIASVGIAASFYVNAFAVLAVTTAVFLMKPPPVMERSAREPMLRAMASGLRFIAVHPVLRWVVFILFTNALLLRPYNFLLPAYALHVVNTGPRGLGWLMAAAGIGGVSGAVLTAAVTTGRRARRWFAASTILALSILLLGLNHNFTAALFILFILGIGSLVFTGSTNILIQTTAPDDMRGRSMAIYSMIMQGMLPAGTFLLGTIASFTNLSDTLVGAAIVGLVIIVWVWLANPPLRDA